VELLDVGLESVGDAVETLDPFHMLGVHALEVLEHPVGVELSGVLEVANERKRQV
jgi:hypothetical protein